MAGTNDDRMVAITEQKRFVDPYQARVFQYDTHESDVFLARVVNSLLKIFGDDVVINGFAYRDMQITFTDNNIYVREPSGVLIQDNTLIRFEKDTNLVLENLSGLAQSGRIAVYVRYQFLKTIEHNPASICLNYIASNGTPRFAWDHTKDRTLIGILRFYKDSDDNIIALEKTDQKYLDISGTRYWLWGINPDKKELTTYLLRMVYKEANTSIEFDDGLRFIGDSSAPGSLRYYGTNVNEVKGWYPFPAEFPDGSNFLQLTDTPSSYTCHSLKLVRVNSLENGLEFYNMPYPDMNMFVSKYNDEVIHSTKIIDGDLHILGNCNIKGTLTKVNENVITTNNPEITLNNGATGAGVASNYAGLRVKRGTLQDALLRFNEQTDTWQVGFEGQTPHKTIALEVTQNNIIDTGHIVEYSGEKYDMTLENGNLILRIPRRS